MRAMFTVNILDDMEVNPNKAIIRITKRNRLGRQTQWPSSRVIVSSTFMFLVCTMAKEIV